MLYFKVKHDDGYDDADGDGSNHHHHHHHHHHHRRHRHHHHRHHGHHQHNRYRHNHQRHSQHQADLIIAYLSTHSSDMAEKLWKARLSSLHADCQPSYAAHPLWGSGAGMLFVLPYANRIIRKNTSNGTMEITDDQAVDHLGSWCW